MLNFLKQQIFPGIYASIVNKEITKKYDLEDDYNVNTSTVSSDINEYIKLVKNDLENQLIRKRRIEDKAKALLFIIAVAIAAITFSLNYIKTSFDSEYQIIAISILFIGIINLIFGAIRSLQSLNIGEYNIYQIEIDNKNPEYILKTKPTDDELLKILIKNKQLNDLINIRLSNYIYASFILIRNGIIMFVLFFILTIGLSYYSHKVNIEENILHRENTIVELRDIVNKKIRD